MNFARKRKDANHEVEDGKKTATKKNKAQICLWMDAEQYKLLKIKAAIKGVTITDVISRYIDIYLEEDM